MTEDLYLKGPAFAGPFLGSTFISIGIAWRVGLLKVHYFCKIFGINSHHIRGSAPGIYGVNICCFHYINGPNYLATAINDGVTMSLAADDADCCSIGLF